EVSSVSALIVCYRRGGVLLVPTSPVRLNRVQALLLDDRCGGFRTQEGHEGRRGLALRRARKHRRGIGDDLLQIARQWSDDVDAGDRQQLANLMDADLRCAARHHGGDGLVPPRRYAFGFDGIGDAEALEDITNVEPARAPAV